MVKTPQVNHTVDICTGVLHSTNIQVLNVIYCFINLSVNVGVDKRSQVLKMVNGRVVIGQLHHKRAAL